MQIDFPESVINFFMGNLGQPTGGFPEKLQQIILKGRKPFTQRPGTLAEDIDFDSTKKELQEASGVSVNVVSNIVKQLVELKILVPDDTVLKKGYRYQRIYETFVGIREY